MANRPRLQGASTRMTEATARKFMEQAVDEMRKSVAEPRDDDKVTPAVGAVLVLPDGDVVRAHRGELRYGDHAEFTLLERKCRERLLEGSALFVTLEPCAPGARKHPKMACAERVFNARVSEVWVGIEDPDPTVARKGIAYLIGKGVEVKMFPPDLQKEILAGNKTFLEQALQRAAAAEEEAEAVVLSPLEAPAPRLTLSDLSASALQQYARRIRASGDEELQASLVAGELVEKDEQGQMRPTGFGTLLFGSAPRNRFPQAGLIGTIVYSDGREETRDFSGPLVEVPDQVVQWLESRLPNLLDRTRIERATSGAGIPFEAIREGVVNALVHRDYDIEGAKIQLRVTPDAVSISSPGAPVPPLTFEQIESFTAPTLSRNPKLHHVFQQMGLAEEAGLGMQTMRSLRRQPGGVVPRFSYEPPYLVLTLHRTAESAGSEIAHANLDELLSPEELRGWELLVRRGDVTATDYAAELGVTARTALRHLNRFIDLGLAVREGRSRSTRYVLRK